MNSADDRDIWMAVRRANLELIAAIEKRYGVDRTLTRTQWERLQYDPAKDTAASR